MTLHRPKTLEDALSLLAGGGVVLAGGTDVYPGLRDAAPPRRMIDVTGIAGLRGIAPDDGAWRIGAATTWTDVIRADLPPAFDGLKLAAREVGSVQIQNAGTIAGNLCNASPAADGVPALLAMDAEVEVTGPDGLRRVPLAAFIKGPRCIDLQPGELVTAIRIPRASGQGGFLKLGARKYLVISIAMVAVVVETDGGCVSRAAVAVGACSPVARRLPLLEAALIGRKPDEIAGLVAGSEMPGITPIDDVRATAGYRSDAVRTLVARTLVQAMEAAHVA